MNICNYFINYLIEKEIILDDDKDVYTYGLFVLLYNSFLVTNILLFGLLFKHLDFSILFLIFWTPYRILVGGSHCSTPFKCCLFFTFYYFISYFIYINIDLLLTIALNSILMIVQFRRKKENLFFLLLWSIYYILILIIPFKYQAIISVSYLMNSILTTHQLIFKEKFIF